MGKIDDELELGQSGGGRKQSAACPLTGKWLRGRVTKWTCTSSAHSPFRLGSNPLNGLSPPQQVAAAKVRPPARAGGHLLPVTTGRTGRKFKYVTGGRSARSHDRSRAAAPDRWFGSARFFGPSRLPRHLEAGGVESTVQVSSPEQTTKQAERLIDFLSRTPAVIGAPGNRCPSGPLDRLLRKSRRGSEEPSPAG